MKSLQDKVVLVTRPADRTDRLVRTLAERGAVPLVAPAIELLPARAAPIDEALRELRAGEFAWIVLTSPATVDELAARIRGAPRFPARVAAVGEGTADAFRRWSGSPPDLSPRTFTTAALARAFPRGSGRVLCARADVAPAGLEDALAAKGWTPLRVTAYRTRLVRSLPKQAREALRSGRVDAVTFTSASTVRGFVGAVEHVRGAPKVICIGPVTAREARDHGLIVHAVARPHTVDGLVAGVERALGRRRSARVR